ncbi:MptD family putative ECF transporter S component [Streptococcus anginosus]|nr:MptD family putative ECF transporter S component [Streptococcus anginosus]MED5938214.1 MptD family putative ECF transporter S component [Streptococcus anginosus]MED5978478.1 MptD family putative ECF transporter S component [Streptococcus anginosus]
MKMEKLRMKDLVTIGVFTVIYFVVMFISGVVGVIPILYLANPAIVGITTGIVMMLFMAKIQKPLAVSILGIISALIVFAMGSTYIVLIHTIIIMVIAELLRKKGEYKSFKYNMMSFAVFNTWNCGIILQIALAKDRFIEMANARNMRQEFTTGLLNLINYRNLVLVYIAAIVGAIIGAYIGKLFLKKHFEKAGIV